MKTQRIKAGRRIVKYIFKKRKENRKKERIKELEPEKDELKNEWNEE